MPGTPNFVALAKQVEDLALEILRRSERQEGLARETAELRAFGEAPDRPIEAMRRWRRATRRRPPWPRRAAWPRRGTWP